MWERAIEIERIAVGPEAMSVREISALLYLPRHTTRREHFGDRATGVLDNAKARTRAQCEPARK